MVSREKSEIAKERKKERKKDGRNFFRCTCRQRKKERIFNQNRIGKFRKKGI